MVYNEKEGRSPKLVARMTEIEFLLNIAKIQLSRQPAQASEFLGRALGTTYDPRLRLLILPVISALKRHDVEAACKWLDRATKHHLARTASKKSYRHSQ